MINSLRLLLILTITAAAIQPTFAQRVYPMVYELAPIGAKSTASMTIENNKSTPLTVELVTTAVTTDDIGNETLIPADDDFLIFPPQAIIQPNKAQTVRIKYVGNPDLDKSVAYRVSVKQLPVNIKKSGHSGVGMVINFNTLVNVVPAKSEANLNIESISDNNDGTWAIVIKNSGNRFARLSKTQWSVSDGNNTKLLDNITVGKMTERNLILPKTILKMNIPAIESFAANNTKILISKK